MPTIPLSSLRRTLSHRVTRIEHTGERLVVMRHGRPVAALVPLSDYEALEEAEDKAADYKEYQVAREMSRWSALKRSLERYRAEEVE